MNEWIKFCEEIPELGAGDIDIFDKSFGTIRHVQAGWYSVFINNKEMFYNDELKNSIWRYSK